MYVSEAVTLIHGDVHNVKHSGEKICYVVFGFQPFLYRDPL